MDNRLFEDARASVRLEDLAGREVKLRGGNDKRGACPLCAAGQKSANPPFSVNVCKQKWTCYSCDEWGDVVDLERQLRGGTAAEAARRLTGGAPSDRPVHRPPPRETVSGPTQSDMIAREIVGGCRPIEGTLARRYLVNRGIDPAVIRAAAPHLRFHPNAKRVWDPETVRWLTAPALVVCSVTPAGWTGGVHVTYLTRSAEKIEKRMWGPHHDREGRPGGAWLIGPEGRGPLSGGEGIETSLSWLTLEYRRSGEIGRAFAALSLHRLQGGVLKDDDRCVDFADPQPNPEMPAFTWPQPLPALAAPSGWPADCGAPWPMTGPWPEVVVLVDADMAQVKAKMRSGGMKARVVPVLLDARARARLCGRMAVRAWRAAGAPRVRAVAAPPGQDFSDVLMRKGDGV